MNIYTQFKIFALLCALPLSSTFAAKPAQSHEKCEQTTAPNSLEDKLAAIDAMSDHDILCAVLPAPLEYCQRLLVKNMKIFKDCSAAPQTNVLATSEAKKVRLLHKNHVTYNEFEACLDNERKQQLQQQCSSFDVQYNAAKNEVQRVANSFNVNNTIPIPLYNYVIARLDVYSTQASLFRAQKEEEKSQWQTEKTQLLKRETQLQQEKTQLLAQLQGYKLLKDGPQIEGVPNVPGGIKQKPKRRGSF